jgi:hypothetical protein
MRHVQLQHVNLDVMALGNIKCLKIRYGDWNDGLLNWTDLDFCYQHTMAAEYISTAHLFHMHMDFEVFNLSEKIACFAFYVG